MLIALDRPPATDLYGVGGFQDTSRQRDYCPWEHAELIGAPIVSNMTLPSGTYAAYSHQMHMIFYRADLAEDAERCAIAHELVHFENRDKGKSAREEARANRISTLRLIRPSRLQQIHVDHSDLPALARELIVTEKVMRLYASMARNGSLPRL